MRTAKEIKQEISELKKEMKSNFVPVKSCFNGGHTSESLRCNTLLFKLKTELERAAQAA